MTCGNEMKMKKWSSQWTQLYLCNCVKKPEKKIQDFNGVWTRDFAITGVMLYQLSYEATDVGSRSMVGSYVPVKEMIVNDIWNKSYMNCGNEMKMKKWSLQWTDRKLLLICCLDTNPYCSTPFHFQTKKNNIFSCCWWMYKSWHNYFRLFTNKKIILFFSSVRPCLLQKHSLWVLTCLQGLLCLQMLGSLMEKISDLLVPLS